MRMEEGQEGMRDMERRGRHAGEPAPDPGTDPVPAGFEERRHEADDGTSVAYWINDSPASADTAEQGKPAIVLSNGIGCPRIVWQDLVSALGTDFTMIFWDYRGTFRSAVPRERTRLHLSDHARDIAGIIRREGLKKVVVLGWSMGVQVNLELWPLIGETMVGMVAINGSGGSTFDTALGVPGLAWWVPPLTHYLGTRHHALLNRILSTLFRTELLFVLRAAGLVGKHVDREMLAALIRGYARHDYDIYFRMLSGLGLHDPKHLGDIRCPVLILAGGRDILTPPITSKRLRARLPNAELKIRPDGTHFMPLEAPRWIRREVEAFIDRLGTRPR